MAECKRSEAPRLSRGPCPRSPPLLPTRPCSLLWLSLRKGHGQRHDAPRRARTRARARERARAHVLALSAAARRRAPPSPGTRASSAGLPSQGWGQVFPLPPSRPAKAVGGAHRRQRDAPTRCRWPAGGHWRHQRGAAGGGHAAAHARVRVTCGAEVVFRGAVAARGGRSVGEQDGVTRGGGGARQTDGPPAVAPRTFPKML
eukprot:154373-Chlamydomonas_euryale.AAC.6